MGGAIAEALSPVAASVLKYWFPESCSEPDHIKAQHERWFNPSADVDYDIERRFGKLVSVASHGGFDSWSEQPESGLALIILLDQCPRNVYRGQKKAFATDATALALAKTAVQKNWPALLSPIKSTFALMPFQRAENAEIQHQGIAALEQLLNNCDDEWRPSIEASLDYARTQHAIIENFGRFPHRNDLLGRPSSPEEIAYLAR